jgi:hypothetical protein
MPSSAVLGSNPGIDGFYHFALEERLRNKNWGMCAIQFYQGWECQHFITYNEMLILV